MKQEEERRNDKEGRRREGKWEKEGLCRGEGWRENRRRMDEEGRR